MTRLCAGLLLVGCGDRPGVTDPNGPPAPETPGPTAELPAADAPTDAFDDVDGATEDCLSVEICNGIDDDCDGLIDDADPSVIVDVGTGEPLKVPHLLGIGSRSPFMHDGCAETLVDRFTDPACAVNEHGVVTDPADVADLVAYLQTL